jgi:hypothetical protein
VFKSRFRLDAVFLERVAAAFELRVVACSGAFLGRGGVVLRAAGESYAGISVNKLELFSR